MNSEISENYLKNYIGIFDSGVGGISVLKEMHRILPHENFLFYGDSANAPYGPRPSEEIRQLAENVAAHLVNQGVKAIVIACNTATSAAAASLRKRYENIPIIGIEPAIKPAANAKSGQRLLVMATEATLRLEKYRSLEKQLEKQAEFIDLACSGLVEFLEQGRQDSPEMHEYLQKLLGPYKDKVDGVILGCTHYPFVKKQIRKVLGDVEFFDGSNGTARELKRQLELHQLTNPSDEEGKIIFQSSKKAEEELELYRKFFSMEI